MTKKRFCYLILFCLIVSLLNVVASDIYDLRDLSNEPRQFVGLYPKDFVRFQYFNATHLVQLEKIISDQEVNIIVFPYKQNGTYLTVGNGRTIHLDLNHDLVDDIQISLFRLQENVSVLEFNVLQSQQTQPNDTIILPPEFTAPNQNTTKINQSDKANPLIGFLIIIIATVTAVILIKLFKKEKK